MANNDTVFPYGTTSRALPAASSDNATSAQRQYRYGEQYTLPLMGSKLHPLADQGTYYVATNATPGTAILGNATPTALSDTVALLFLRLGASSTKRLMLDYIQLQVSAVGTSSTNFAFAMKGDKGTSRFTSGGTAITSKNANMASSTTSDIDRLQFGDITCAAATSEARLLHHGLLRTVIKVAGDKYLFTFGNSSPSPSSGIPLEGTLQASIQVACPPVVLGAGDSFLLHEFAASQAAAASYQFTMGWWEV